MRKFLMVLGMVVLAGTLSGCHEVFCGFVEGLTGQPLDCSHDDFPDFPDTPFPSLPPPPSLPTTTTTTLPSTTTSTAPNGTTTTEPDGTTTTTEPDGTTTTTAASTPTTTAPPVSDPPPTTTGPSAAAQAPTNSVDDVRAGLRQRAEDRITSRLDGEQAGPTTGTTRPERSRVRR